MSEKEFKYNIHLLENINGMQCLVEAENLEYLNEEGIWESFSNFGVSLIPIILYSTCELEEDMSKITYQLNYELIIPHICITPNYTEQITLFSYPNEERPYNKEYIKYSNPSYNDDIKIRYNNKGINTFSKIKSQSTVSDYLAKNRRKLFSLAAKINDIIKSSEKTKTYAKKDL